MKYPPRTLGLPAIIALSASLLAAGCNTRTEPRDLMSEEVRGEHIERPVAMKGDAEFGGAIHVVATVSRGFDRRPGQKVTAGPKVRKGWFQHDTDAYKEDVPFDIGESEEQQREAIKDYMRQALARRAAGSPMPPVTLHVAFENNGIEAVEIEPTEVNSDLGNFAVRPKKLMLAPGEVGSLDPMVSQLGVLSDEIPVTISVRVHGKTSTRVIQVKNIIASSLRNG